jgi:hypothetical protein
MFISVDPLVSTTGEPHLYASGNPITLSDRLEPGCGATAYSAASCGQAHGAVGTVTGATSAPTGGQRSQLDGSAVEAMVGQQVGTCAAMWFACQELIRDPGGHWDFDDASDAAAFEATRQAYRHSATLARSA